MTTTVTDFRKLVHDFASSSFIDFCGGSSNNEGLKVTAPDGGHVYEFSKYKKKGENNTDDERRKRFDDEILSMIWVQRQTPFDRGCGRKYHCKDLIIMTILAMRFRRSFVCCRVGKEPRTHFCHYSNGKVVVYQKEGEWYSPPPGSVCIVHNGGNHYDYLRPHSSSVGGSAPAQGKRAAKRGVGAEPGPREAEATGVQADGSSCCLDPL
mmetsp:Transcript_22636/g.49147  ORF Transcript_22636/g.49147 Transcript_22636/m.49147 type:complete len:209 (-) Transcript_22636:267-893(-)